METPIEIEFHEIEVSPTVETMVRDHVHELENRYGRITSCRVVVTGPGERHRSGGLFDVRIHLSLPQGREVSVNRLDRGDERHSVLEYAINDAFKRARRQLQDRARKMQGQIKHHEALPSGTIDRIDPSGEHGFIVTPDGQEVYFHKNSVLAGTFDRLQPGMRVTFAEEQGEKGLQASTVKLMGKHSLR